MPLPPPPEASIVAQKRRTARTPVPLTPQVRRAGEQALGRLLVITGLATGWWFPLFATLSLSTGVATLLFDYLREINSVCD